MAKKISKVGKGTMGKLALGAGALAAGYLLLGPNGKHNRKKIQDWSEKVRKNIDKKELVKFAALLEQEWEKISNKASAKVAKSVKKSTRKSK